MIEPIKSANLGADTESPQLASEYLEIKESYRFYVITYSSLIIIRNEILSLYQAVQHLSPPLVQFLLIIPSFSLQPPPFASSSSLLSMLSKLPLPFPVTIVFLKLQRKCLKSFTQNSIQNAFLFLSGDIHSDNLPLQRSNVE